MILGVLGNLAILGTLVTLGHLVLKNVSIPCLNPLDKTSKKKLQCKAKNNI